MVGGRARGLSHFFGPLIGGEKIKWGRGRGRRVRGWRGEDGWGGARRIEGSHVDGGESELLVGRDYHLVRVLVCETRATGQEWQGGSEEEWDGEAGEVAELGENG